MNFWFFALSVVRHDGLSFLGNFTLFWMAKMATNGQLNHSGQSEVSENGPNGFPMHQNLGIDTKIKSLACLEPKLKFGHFILFDRPKWPFLPLRSIQGVWKWSQWISHAQNLWDRHQNQVYGMFRTKVTNLAILSHFDWPKWPQTAILVTQVNLRCLKMVPMDFPCPKTKG